MENHTQSSLLLNSCKFMDQGSSIQQNQGLPTFYFIEVQLIYNIVLFPAVQQGNPVIHIYIYFHIIFYYDLSQDNKYSYLYYIIGPCFFSSCILVCICSSHSFPPTPFSNQKSVLCVCKSVSVCRYVHLCHILDSTYE